MRVLDLIDKKKHNKELSLEEIKWLVTEFTKGNIPDYQMSAFLMAVYFNGLNDMETFNLTLAMQNSGDSLDLSSIKGCKVDKHSSGGVGDKVTLVLVGIIGALDIPFAKMSGRGLGHTGGTIDKLESIPGFRTNLSEEEFINNVNDIGVAIACQTADLAPADKKIYALRDVTSTVDEVSLIASSIMSKKLASGCDGIVLDVTTGSGAFMREFEDAKELATKMVDIGKYFNVDTVAVITNMDEPLGNAVGNALEVAEAVQALKGYGPNDLMDVVYTVASYMLLLAKKTDNLPDAKMLIQSVIDNGSAYNKFLEFIERQGGDSNYVKNYDSLINASIIREVKAESSGYIHKIDALKIGRAVHLLGGGREKITDEIDVSVGIVLNKKISDTVKIGQVIAYIYGNDEAKVTEAYNNVIDAYDIQDEEVSRPRMILDVIK